MNDNSPSALKLSTLLERLEEAILVADCDLVIREWSPGAEALFGWAATEARGRSLDILQAPGVAASVANAVRAVFAGSVRWRGELPFVRKNGTPGMCEASIAPLDGSRVLLSIRDVTQRANNIEALTEERRLLRTVIDAVADPIFLKDAEGRHVIRNRAEREITGLPDSAVFGKKVTEIGFSPEIAAKYAEDDATVLSTGKPIFNREEPFVFPEKNGWFLTNKHPVFDEAGKVVGIVGIARDITEQKRAADELDATRQQLSQHLDNSLLVVAELDPALRITRWNDRAAQVFGWSAAEAIGRTPVELNAIHAEDAADVHAAFGQLVNGTARNFTAQNRNLTKDGRTIHCRWFNSVLRDSAGRVRSFLTMAEDVTAQVEAEEKLRASDRLLATLIEATNTGYLMLDEQGCILFSNEKYLPFLGFESPAKLAGHSIRDIIAPHHHEQLFAGFARILRDGAGRNIELDVTGTGGRTAPFEFNARVENTETGLHIHVFLRDITVRSRALDERQAIERKLQETQKLESLGVLAGGIAHDFNNLLTGILGNASLAAASVPEDLRVHAYFEQIETAALRAADLCRQMLAYAGKGRFVVQPVGLNDVVRETSELLRLSISKRVNLDFRLGQKLPSVQADATQLRQVFMNLVINASEAIGERSGTIRVASGTAALDGVALSAAIAAPDARPGDYVWFEVTDDGCGMTGEVLTRIFDPFFTTKFTGRGLGLAAVLGIVRGHGGALTVESTPGLGTVFRVHFPAATTAVETAEAAPAKPAWKGEGRVLVVDDEDTVRITAANILAEIGFQPVIARDGREAIEKFAVDAGIRLVLLDLTMPQMDGEETATELRRIRPGAKILLMSGFTEQEATARFGRHGLAGFIPKPFNVAQLTVRVRAAIHEG